MESNIWDNMVPTKETAAGTQGSAAGSEERKATLKKNKEVNPRSEIELKIFLGQGDENGQNLFDNECSLMNSEFLDFHL